MPQPVTVQRIPALDFACDLPNTQFCSAISSSGSLGTSMRNTESPMNVRNKVARILVALGAIILSASTAVHSAYYTKLTPVLSASNLSVPLQAAVRAVFLLVGWDWIVIAVVALLAAFTETKLRKALVLICGVAILSETGLTLAIMGVFLGSEMIGSAALLIICGGLLFQTSA